MSKNLLLVKTNIQGAQARRITHVDGREYLIAPMVMIHEGVLNGELVTSREIGDFFWTWAGRPIVINHPIDDAGQYISANNPEILAQAPGVIYNPSFVDDKLLAEAWLDTAKATQLGGDALDVMQRIERGEMVELSTGYFRDLIEGSGEFNGESYYAIATNFHPDHLALLPNDVGACSISDGCGVPRANQQEQDGVMIAFYPRAEDAARLVMDAADLPNNSQAIPPNDLHLTLAYLGKIADLDSIQNLLLDRLNMFAQDAPLIRAKIAGMGEFNPQDDNIPLIALIEADYLQEWRRELIWWVLDDVDIKREWSFIPHITLAYIPNIDNPVEIPQREPIDLVFDRIALSWGNQKTFFSLQGETMDQPIALEQQDDSKSGFFGSKPVEFIKQIFNRLKGKATMKEQLIKDLIVNGCTVKKETLESFDCDTLKALSEDYKQDDGDSSNTPDDGDPSNTPDDGAGEQDSGDGKGQAQPADEAPAGNAVNLGVVMSEIKKVGDQVNDLSVQVNQGRQQERDALAAQIAANQDIFSLDDLKDKSLADLQKLAQLTTPADYSLLAYPGVAANRGDNKDWEAYERPSQDQ